MLFVGHRRKGLRSGSVRRSFFSGFIFRLACRSIALVTAALAAGRAFLFADPQLAVMATIVAIPCTHSVIPRNVAYVCIA